MKKAVQYPANRQSIQSKASRVSMIWKKVQQIEKKITEIYRYVRHPEYCQNTYTLNRNIATNEHNYDIPDNVYMFLNAAPGKPKTNSPTKELQYSKTTNYFRSMKDIASFITSSDNGLSILILYAISLGKK